MMGPATLSLSDKLLNSNCLSSQYALDSRRESLISNLSDISAPSFYSSSPLPDNQTTDGEDIT